MRLQDHCPLKKYNTFGIDATADRMMEYESVEELQAFIQQRLSEGNTTPLLHIGDGSNLLFLHDFKGTILRSGMKEIHVTADEGDYVYVRVTAGIVWDDWVQYAVDSNWYGLENLPLIPGTVGASAVQNIGAYGVEAKDFIIFVDTVDLQTGEVRHFTAEECRYGYRDSAFKHEVKGRYAVTHVHFRLSHSFRPNLEYGGIHKALAERDIDETNLTAEQLRQTIIEIRRAKLPEPSLLGNAGSFFTNPIVPKATFERLLNENPNMPHYEVDNSSVKIPAGWMIEQCGWKGKTLGKAGVYERQALVLVNRGGATGADIKALCERIQEDVEARFGIHIEPEVNFIA
jgi:UDP-N-acetylmuramate dehydrogenase